MELFEIVRKNDFKYISNKRLYSQALEFIKVDLEDFTVIKFYEEIMKT